MCVSDRVNLFVVMLVAVAFVGPTVQAGPFLGADPVREVAEATSDGVHGASQDVFALTQATWKATAETVNAAQGGRLANTTLISYFGEVGTHGRSLVNNTGDVTKAGIIGGGEQAVLGLRHGQYLGALALERAGIEGRDGQPPVAASGPDPCIGGETLIERLGAVQPGDEITVCAGTFSGDLRITTEFVTLRSAQGPYATTLSGGVSIQATGVTIAGFTITGGGVTVGGEGDGYTGEIWGTLLYGNIIQGNAVGVTVGHAFGTLLVGNTIRANGVGVSASADLTEPAAGTVLALNNLERNGKYAIRSDGVPVVSVGDHYGAAAPAVALADGTCAGAGLTDTRCRNAAGPGAIVVGFSPVRHATL